MGRGADLDAHVLPRRGVSPDRGGLDQLQGTWLRASLRCAQIPFTETTIDDISCSTLAVHGVVLGVPESTEP